MNLLQSLILGIVEGLTEFLPISSTAHLILVSKLLNIPQTDFVKFFEVFIQSGAILAVLVLYVQYVINNKEVMRNIISSFIPTAIIGFALYKVIKGVLFESITLISIVLIGVGILFIGIEKLIKKKKIIQKKSIKHINDRTAFLIGLFQSLAVIPGVSRSGIVMVGMMALGFKREEAAIYSFLLAVPTIGAASLFDLFKMRSLLMSSLNLLPVLLVGFITSFIVAYIVIKWFIGFLKKNTLIPFGIYRIILGILLFWMYR
ncbi:undecaprenyl-diphosphatase [Candidatus Roizmanbacteria bacterium CG_4_10_14_0_8_um_filter_33_9]|uniref:Undecaprenyl-diphosphatase n=1 Tax=Candidatus Roizmanbacteria bacterium CG_4_10_14_0_8_um_filter_33_9 TaxID=1974826 RepID=A0A2M7QID0_9BACT|nr:MAG: undecaprenyl-diphosphatase [Candidatus Roizmanbacteria bacterium CG_4_10_14_0_8_um_filter_33_9]